jgi:hypothetical protein
MTADGLRAVLADRADACTYRVARLKGWRRIWNAYRVEWQGGVLNVEYEADSEVVGVLIEGLSADDLTRLDSQESTHLPRIQVIVVLEDGDAVPAQMYCRPRGNHAGRPAARYQQLVLERATAAGPSVLESLRQGSVDAKGRALVLS